MFKNYFTTAIRNLLRQKVYAFINVFGLAIGIAFCILIFLFVHNEWTYDTFHTKSDRIYRLIHSKTLNDGRVFWSTGPRAALGPLLKRTFPEIEGMVRFMGNSRTRVTLENQTFIENVTHIDPDGFRMFSFSLKNGTLDKAFSTDQSLVISQKMAQKYFGDKDPIGKTLEIQSYTLKEKTFTITGVAEEIPQNSSITFDFLIPFSWIDRDDDWKRTDVSNVYLLLARGTKLHALENKINTWIQTLSSEDSEGVIERTWPTTQYLQPLTDIHYSPLKFAGRPTFNPMYVYVLTGIALSVLLIACINFMTLSIGQASMRCKEIGIRKVVGASRLQLMKQFWGEAILLSFVALVLGLMLAEFSLPTFNTLTDKEFLQQDLHKSSTLIFLVGLALLTGLFAGGYPALVLSKFHPLEVLRNRLRLGGKNLFARSLVVLQFGIAIFLISSSLIMSRQLTFLSQKELGFDKEALLNIPFHSIHWRNVNQTAKILKNEILGQSRIVSATVTTHTLVSEGPKQMSRFASGDTKVSADKVRIDYDYLETIKVPLVEGRNLSQEFGSDEKLSILVNESLVNAFGWKKPIGQKLRDYTVVGVVKDFHFRSLHQQIDPAYMILGSGSRLLVRIQPEDIQTTLSFLEETWKKVVPGHEFKFSFVDEDIDRQYRTEFRWRKIVGIASGFTILVACMGIFGLTALAVTRRTKEIGIRKVMGATTSHIYYLFSREFILLIGISALMAWPVAYYATNAWLQDFAFRIDIGLDTFVLGGLAILIIAQLTASYQVFKAAYSNPVDALRNE